MGVPTSKYGWIGNGSMFTVDWIVCSLQSAADKKGPSRQKRAQRLLLKVIFFSFWKLSLNIWSHHKPEFLAGFNSIQYSMMKSFYVFWIYSVLDINLKSKLWTNKTKTKIYCREIFDNLWYNLGNCKVADFVNYLIKKANM